MGNDSGGGGVANGADSEIDLRDRAVRLLVSSVIALALFSGAHFAVAAQGSPPSRLIGVPQPLPRDGTYVVADDSLIFLVDRRGDSVRLRFGGGDEVFYL